MDFENIDEKDIPRKYERKTKLTSDKKGPSDSNK